MLRLGTICVALASATQQEKPNLNANTISSLVSWPKMPHPWDVAAVQQKTTKASIMWSDVTAPAVKRVDPVKVPNAPIRSRLMLDGASFADDLADALTANE